MLLSSPIKSRHLLYVCFTIVLMVSFIPFTTLRVVNLKTDEIIIEKNMLQDNHFTVRWIHSVELTPWEELFQVTDGHIYLEETRFQSFGAGVPDAIGTTSETAGGYVTYSGIHQEMPSLVYGVSPIAQHELIIGKSQPTTYVLYELLPADTPVSFEAHRTSLFKQLLQDLLN